MTHVSRKSALRDARQRHRWRCGLALALILAGAHACASPETPAPEVAPSGASGTTTAAVTHAPAAELPGLLVMPLVVEPGLESSAKALDELALTLLHGLKRYRVMGPADLNALLGVEALKDAVGCDDVSCAAELGGALGAPFLVAGQLARLGDQVTISLKLMDTKAPSVLARSSQRGGARADALATSMATAVGELFGIELAAPRAISAAEDYTEYTGIVTAMGKLMGNLEYTRALAELDRLEPRAASVRAPMGQSLEELLVMYRATACAMLKRAECTRAAVSKYRERWPEGTYRLTMDTFADHLDTAEAQSGDKAELRRRLSEIDEQGKKGVLDALQVRELQAYAYMSAHEPDEAARRFLKLLDEPLEAERAITLVQAALACLEQTGQYEEARALLARIEKRYPREYKAASLHQRARMLPK